jgi:hypothetical protein
LEKPVGLFSDSPDLGRGPCGGNFNSPSIERTPVYFQTGSFEKKVRKYFKSTFCTNFSGIKKIPIGNPKPFQKLSTVKMREKSVKVGYQQSYPHYPHFFQVR